MMYGTVSTSTLLLMLLSTATPTNGKQILLASVGGYHDAVTHMVAIDISTGNATKLYQLPPPLGGMEICLRIDPKRNLIHSLRNSDNLDTLTLYELSLSDGHLITTYTPINNFTKSDIFTQWDFDFESRTLYGICLNQSETVIYWNYTWCSAKFNESGVGETKHGFFATVDSEPAQSGSCSKISMNRNTFSTGEYWYSVGNYLFVRNVMTSSGKPGDILWEVEDKVGFDAMQFAALVTGKAEEYAIVVQASQGGSFAVVKIKPDSSEVIVQLPQNLTTAGVGIVNWDYDPNDEKLYLLMTTNLDRICDTLVTVDIKNPTNSRSSRAIRTLPLPLKSLFDPDNYFVDDVHLVEWPPSP